MPDLLGSTYKELYEGYYDTGITGHRGLVAQDTLDHFRAVLGSDRFSSALDVGAGEGSLLEALNNGSIAEQLHGLEISDSGLRAIRARNLSRLVRCEKFDGYTLPYADRSIDLVISVHVMEHVEHERMALQEMRRVGKRLIIEVPIEHNIRVYRSIDSGKKFGHINFYSPEVFGAKLESCGFRVIRSRVMTQSLAYEQLCSGRWKGFMKYLLRRSLVRLAPRIAPFLMVYSFIAYCE